MGLNVPLGKLTTIAFTLIFDDSGEDTTECKRCDDLICCGGILFEPNNASYAIHHAEGHMEGKFNEKKKKERATG